MTTNNTRRTLFAFALAACAALASVPAEAQDGSIIRAKFEFTAQEVRDFGTTGVEILAPVPGHYYQIVQGTWVKRAGDAFTVSSFGHFVQAQYENASFTPAGNWLSQGVLDQTDESSSVGGPFAVSLYASGGPGVGSIKDIGGRGVRLGVNGGGAFTGTGSDCILDLHYRLLPSTSEDLDLVDTTPLP